MVVLAPEPQGHFVVGHLHERVDPLQFTVVVNAHGATHACLVGWAPGSVVVVERPGVVVGAPSVVIDEGVEAHGHVGGVTSTSTTATTGTEAYWAIPAACTAPVGPKIDGQPHVPSGLQGRQARRQSMNDTPMVSRSG